MANFVIQQMRERHINKFNINGFDYKVKVDMTKDDITYAEAWQNLHDVLSGRFFSMKITTIYKIYFLTILI